MRKPRFAKQFIFWLNLEDESEYAIAETIEELKDRRQFSKSIRDGLRLVVDLSRGKTDVLKELFPTVLDDINSPNSSAGGNGGTNTPDSEINALRADIQRLEQALLSERVPPAMHMAKQLASHATPEYTLNDLPLLGSKAAKSNGNSRQNLLSALSNISGTAKINLKPEPKPEASGIKTIANSGVELAEPTFDMDLEL